MAEPSFAAFQCAVKEIQIMGRAYHRHMKQVNAAMKIGQEGDQDSVQQHLSDLGIY